MKLRKKVKNTLIGSFFTILVIVLLILSGPANAFVVSMGNFNKQIAKGEIIWTIANLTINSNERVMIDSIYVDLNDGVSQCHFNPYTGQKITNTPECSWLYNIDVLATPSELGYGYGYNQGEPYGYGYHYGYSNGQFIYNISINTSGLPTNNSVRVVAQIKTNPYSSDPVQFQNDEQAPQTSIPSAIKIISNTPYTQGEWSNEFVNLTLMCEDEAGENLGSGCYGTYYNINNGTTQNYTAPITIDTPGINVVYYWSVDNVGNVEESKTFIVRIAVPGPEGIGGDWGFPDGSTPESAENVTLVGNLTITFADGSEIFLEDGTTITSSDGSNLNLSALTSSLVNLSQLIGIDGAVGALQFGIPNFGLNFTPPITLRINVTTAYEGQTLNIYRSLSGNGNWTQDGLVNTNCVVSGGICEFKTNKASYFATTFTPSAVTTVFAAGGGYCSTQWTCSEWSACENGVQTRTCSYPANFCAPTIAKPEETRACTAETPVTPTPTEPATNPGNQAPAGGNLFTGLAIGAREFFSNPLNSIITIIVVLVVLGGALWMVKKRRIKKQQLKKK